VHCCRTRLEALELALSWCFDDIIDEKFTWQCANLCFLLTVDEVDREAFGIL